MTRGGLRVGVAYDSPSALYVGAAIKVLRTKAGLKQSELARQIQIDKSIVSLWEVDRRPVPVARVADLARVLDVTEDALLREYTEEYHRLLAVILAGPDADVALYERVVPVEPEPEPAPLPQVPDTRLWCEHGGRRHHHGPAPSWGAGVLAIKDLW